MQTTIPPERRQRIDALGFDYATQPKDRLPACNLCGGTVLVTLTHRDRYGYPAEASAPRIASTSACSPTSPCST